MKSFLILLSTYDLLTDGGAATVVFERTVRQSDALKALHDYLLRTALALHTGNSIHLLVILILIDNSCSEYCLSIASES